MNNEKNTIIYSLIKRIETKLRQSKLIIDKDRFNVKLEDGNKLQRDFYNVEEKRYYEKGEEIKLTNTAFYFSHELLDSTIFQMISLLYNIEDCDKKYQGNLFPSDSAYYRLRLLLNHSRIKDQRFGRTTVLSTEVIAEGDEDDYVLKWHVVCIVHGSLKDFTEDDGMDLLLLSEVGDVFNPGEESQKLMNGSKHIPACGEEIIFGKITLLNTEKTYNTVTFVIDINLLLSEIDESIKKIKKMIKNI